MARVRSLQQGAQDVRVHPSEVDCFYQSIVSASGEKFVHLTTFGSEERVSRPKSSQSLQLDERTVRQLIDVLRKAFPSP